MNEELGDLLIDKEYFQYYDPHELDQYNESDSDSRRSDDSNHEDNSENDYPKTPDSSSGGGGSSKSGKSDEDDDGDFGVDENEKRMKKLFDMMRSDDGRVKKGKKGSYQGALMDGWYGEEGSDEDEPGYYTRKVNNYSGDDDQDEDNEDDSYETGIESDQGRKQKRNTDGRPTKQQYWRDLEEDGDSGMVYYG